MGNVKNTSQRIILAFQHLFAMLGATITVPMLTGMSTSLALISSGLGTIAFHFITKRKVPVYLGSSFAFLGALTSFFATDHGQVLDPAIMGKVAVAIALTGCVYLFFSLLVKLMGPGFVKRLFPPVVVGPVIICIGLILAPSGAFPLMSGSGAEGWIVSIITALTIVCVSVFAKGYLKMLPILMGIIVGYIAAICFGMVDFSPFLNANWVIFEPEAFEASFGFYKHLGFDFDIIIALVPIAIVTFMEHIGDIKANGAVVGQDFFKDPGLHRTLIGDGVATLIAGCVGGPPNTTYGENTGVLALTKNYDPKIILNAAIFAVILGVFSKFGGLLATLPGPVVGGASVILYGMITAQGLKTLVDGKVDFTKNRNLMIAALILMTGLGLQFSGISIKIGTVQISSLALATLVGIIANLVLPKSQRENMTEINLGVTSIETINDEMNQKEDKE